MLLSLLTFRASVCKLNSYLYIGDDSSDRKINLDKSHFAIVSYLNVSLLHYKSDKAVWLIKYFKGGCFFHFYKSSPYILMLSTLCANAPHMLCGG